ncbi:Initiation-specific alpha-1,6-mannosyltransferase 1 [Phlyctema vagabunda]|uniref:Initiation-specific alpha-1,6-mannosyltransferase 1 n=1 Tax=Phlyctema vagabunda TaxID=108571 RepID=A0ABR4PPQ4_9HELO
MHLVRRGLRSLRSTPCNVVALLILLLIYIFHPPSTIKSPSEPRRQKSTHDSTPTYEHLSPYRALADHAFESSLEAQLTALEKHVGQAGTEANQTVWQIGTRDEAEMWAQWRKQWHIGDPEWKYELLTTSEADAAPILSLYSDIPEVTNAYADFPALRTDLLRYLILWYHGGFFAEVDTWPRVALKFCSPIVQVTSGRHNISLMVGVEIDEPYLNPETKAVWKWSRSFGFGQAVVWAPRRFDPILRRAIVRAITHMKMQAWMQDQQEPESVWRRFFGRRRISNMGEVSGSSMLTDCVLDVLSETLRQDHAIRDREAGLERRVTWKHFRKLEQPVWIDPEETEARQLADLDMRGLAVLPINIWASGQRHSRSGSFEMDEACVDHVFGRTPAGMHKGFMNRIFGW